MSSTLHLFVLFLFFVFTVREGATVHGSPPKVLESVERKFRIPIGQKLFRLICPVIGGEKEMLMIEWEKNGEQIQWDSRYKMAKDNKELRMKNVRLEDSGRYQCQATNGFGHQTVDFTVHVYDPQDTGVSVKDKLVLSNSTSAPNWLIDMDLEWSSPVQVNRGGRLELRCPARGNPMPEIRWYKNNMLLNSDAPPHIASFTVDPAGIEDSGDYRCLVENRLGSIDAVFKVTVGDFFEDSHQSWSDNVATGPEPEIDVPYNVTVAVGHTAQFQCKAKASESPLIKWLKEVADPAAARRADPNATIVSANGMHLLVLDQNQVESVTKDSADNQYINKLVIPAVTKSAAGKYICVVTSNQGHIVYKSAILYVTYNGIDLSSLSSSQLVWVMLALGVIIFIFIVSCAIIMLKKFQEPSTPEKYKQPPPPKIPLPAAPIPFTPTLNRSFNHDLEKGTRSPVILNNTMFQKPLGGTLDRRTYLRSTARGYDEMSHVYDCSSPQPQQYWGVRHQPIYTPPSSNYRTLEVAFGRAHPSICTEEYAEQEPFIPPFRR